MDAMQDLDLPTARTGRRGSCGAHRAGRVHHRAVESPAELRPGAWPNISPASGQRPRGQHRSPLKWVDGEPTIDEHGHFGFNGLFEVSLKSEVDRMRGTLDCLTRPLRKKTVRVKATGETFQTHVPTEEGKRYIIDVKSITARERAIIRQDPHTGQVTWAEVKPSGFEKLVQPKEEHIGLASQYAYYVTRAWFQHERLDGKPLETPPDIMILYQAKDLDPKYYEKEPETYPDPKGLLNSPFKIFTVPYEQKRVDANLAKAKEIWDCLDRGELPPGDHKHLPSRPAWPCVEEYSSRFSAARRDDRRPRCSRPSKWGARDFDAPPGIPRPSAKGPPPGVEYPYRSSPSGC